MWTSNWEASKVFGCILLLAWSFVTWFVGDELLSLNFVGFDGWRVGWDLCNAAAVFFPLSFDQLFFIFAIWFIFTCLRKEASRMWDPFARHHVKWGMAIGIWPYKLLIYIYIYWLVIKMKIAILRKWSETKQNVKKILAFKIFYIYISRLFIYFEFICSFCVYNVFIICFIW